MERFKKNLKWYILGFLSIMAFLIWSAVLAETKDLKIAFLDVGQGDAVYIEAPGGRQMIVDGGPRGALIGALAEVMPFYDRSIDVILVTNPDADHFAGFIDLLKNYEVGLIVESGTYNSSKTYAEFESLSEERGVPRVIAFRGTKIDLGGGAVLEVLFPDRDVSFWKPNEGSLVGRLSYGDISVMLAGDSVAKTERIIVENGDRLASDILKAGHHGSRTSTSEEFLRAISPSYAVISSGSGNSYGHPHAEVLDTLERLGVRILRTDRLGTIIFRTDGRNLELEYSVK